MVLYSIPNLNESFSIEYSIPAIKDGIARIPFLDTNYKLATLVESFDSVILETKEFLNSAVFVSFNLVPIQEHRTDVTIEIRRKKRSFDKNFKGTNTFISIENLILQLSEALAITTTKIHEL